MWNWVKNRLTESTTWAGLAAFAAIFYPPAGLVLGKVGSIVTGLAAGGLIVAPTSGK